MEHKIKDFEREFVSLKISKREPPLGLKDLFGDDTSYDIKGFNGYSELNITVKKEEDLEFISRMMRKSFYVFPDFLAIKYETTIEVTLTPLSFRTSLRNVEREDDENFTVIEIGLNYYRNELNIKLEVGEDDKHIPQFMSLIRGRLRFSRRRPIILRVENFTKASSEGIDNDIRNIVNSVLFDVEYNYGLAFETVNVESLSRRLGEARQRHPELPKSKINLVYKKYIPELIQYFHLAEKVDFLPFKFICYYHIIEYFSDKSAYYIVSKEVKKLLLKPDFHLKTDNYVNQAINLFKKENEKNTGDKIKIERVFRQYIKREDIKEILSQMDLLDHFSKDATLDCAKPLRLVGVNFDNDGNFYSELTKRIYAVRCSIVHSNPDFDESKAVPFNPTPSNIDKLRVENSLMMEIARKIIIDSIE